MLCAPIVLFVYSRLDHTKLTIKALLKNNLAIESDLFIYADHAKNESALEGVGAVREYIKTISGFKSVTIYERPFNYGLSKSIISGVTEILKVNNSIIVIEDDLIVSPYFLQYMNDALNLYEHEQRVVSIHAYVYPVRTPLPETFFLRGADCWGWATWRRGWEIFNTDGQFLLDELKRKNLLKSFDYNGTYSFSKMLQGQVDGKNDSWAVRWHASAFLADKLTLYPGKSLVHNIGNDSSGTHCGSSNALDVEVSQRPVQVRMIDLSPLVITRNAFESFFKSMHVSMFARVKNKFKSTLKYFHGAS